MSDRIVWSSRMTQDYAKGLSDEEKRNFLIDRGYDAEMLDGADLDELIEQDDYMWQDDVEDFDRTVVPMINRQTYNGIVLAIDKDKDRVIALPAEDLITGDIASDANGMQLVDEGGLVAEYFFNDIPSDTLELYSIPEGETEQQDFVQDVMQGYADSLRSDSDEEVMPVDIEEALSDPAVLEDWVDKDALRKVGIRIKADLGESLDECGNLQFPKEELEEEVTSGIGFENAKRFVEYLKDNDGQNGYFGDEEIVNRGDSVHLYSQVSDMTFTFTDDEGVVVEGQDEEEGTYEEYFDTVDDFVKWYQSMAFTFSSDLGAELGKYLAGGEVEESLTEDYAKYEKFIKKVIIDTYGRKFYNAMAKARDYDDVWEAVELIDDEDIRDDIGTVVDWCQYKGQVPYYDVLGEIVNEFELDDNYKESLSEAEEKATKHYMCDDCGYECDLTDDEYDGMCPNCHEHHGFYEVEEESLDEKVNTLSREELISKLKDRLINKYEFRLADRWEPESEYEKPITRVAYYKNKPNTITLSNTKWWGDNPTFKEVNIKDDNDLIKFFTKYPVTDKSLMRIIQLLNQQESQPGVGTTSNAQGANESLDESCGKVEEGCDKELDEAKGKGQKIMADNPEALAEELEEIEMDLEDFGPEGFYNVPYESFKKEFPEFTKDVIETFLVKFVELKPEELNDPEVIEAWKSGDLITEQDWPTLLEGARDLAAGKPTWWIAKYEKNYKESLEEAKCEEACDKELKEGNVDKLVKHYGPMFDKKEEELKEEKDYLVVPGDLDVLK